MKIVTKLIKSIAMVFGIALLLCLNSVVGCKSVQNVVADTRASPVVANARPDTVNGKGLTKGNDTITMKVAISAVPLRTALKPVEQMAAGNMDALAKQAETLDKITQVLTKQEELKLLALAQAKRADDLQKALDLMRKQFVAEKKARANDQLKSKVRENSNRTLVAIVKYLPLIVGFLLLCVSMLFFWLGRRSAVKQFMRAT